MDWRLVEGVHQLLTKSSLLRGRESRRESSVFHGFRFRQEITMNGNAFVQPQRLATVGSSTPGPA